jgi:hypothetical protein
MNLFYIEVYGPPFSSGWNKELAERVLALKSFEDQEKDPDNAMFDSETQHYLEQEVLSFLRETL